MILNLWEYSSFHKWVEKDGYKNDWGCTCSGRKPQVPDFSEIAQRSTGYSSVSNFRVEDSQYYSYRVITAENGDGFGVAEIIWALEAEFDIEITDEIAGTLTTVRQAVDYISTTINPPSS